MRTQVVRKYPWLILMLAGFFIVPFQPARATIGTVTTWLGKLYAGDKGNANLAYLDTPMGLTTDAACNIYIADTQNRVIRKIAGSTNIINTFAGTGNYGLTDGITRTATFRQPSDVALGPNNELYVTDSASTVARRIAKGVVSTWITGLSNPLGVIVSGQTIYIADTGHNRIVKASTTNPKTTVVATGIKSIGKMALLGNDLYVTYNGSTSFGRVNLTTKILTPLKRDFTNADGVTVYNNLVYVVSGLHGVINEIWTYNPANSAFTKIKSRYEDEWYNHASDITFCHNSMLVLFSGGSSIYRLQADGTNEVKIAGVHRWTDLDGPIKTALVGRPWLLAMSPNNRYLYLLVNEQLKEVDLKTNQLKYLAGHDADNYVDGSSSNARVSGPTQMVINAKGTILYIADRNNNRIRAYDLKTGTMSTVTGAGIVNAFAGEHNAYAEGNSCPTTLVTGVAGCAYFDRPTGMAISPDGKTLYVSDGDNNRLRTVNVQTGQTKLLAGTGKAGLKNGPATKALFNKPASLLLSRDGKSLYVVETGNHDIRLIDLGKKTVSTLVGTGKSGYLDGNFTTARLSLPNYLAFGPNSNTLYLSEGGTLRIRQLNLKTKTISTLAGSGQPGDLNGPANQASFGNPRQLVMLNSSTLLVADHPNDMIRAVSLK